MWKKLNKLPLSFKIVTSILVIIGILALDVGDLLPYPVASLTSAQITTEPEFKVAFIGDTGNGSNFSAVLNLIQQEGADMVLVQGDYSYGTGNDGVEGDADGYFARVDSILGPTFPFMGSVGNHEDLSWPTDCSKNGVTDGCFAQYIVDRANALPDLEFDASNIDNEYWTATYKGLKIVFAGQDSSDLATYSQHINSELANDDHTWKICSWHKNGVDSPFDGDAATQVGGKGTSMTSGSYNLYQDCLGYGAIIATGHEHSYSRTVTLDDLTFMNQNAIDTSQHPLTTINGYPNVPSNPNSVLVAPGKTFVFVSGIGGASIRNQDRCTDKAGFNYPYGCVHEWAKIATSDQLVKNNQGVDFPVDYGALFISFNVGGNADKAHAYFKDINGIIVDEFDITKSSSPVGSPTPPPGSTPTPLPTPTLPPGDVLTFNPVDDASIMQESPTTNYGSSSRLEADGSPIQQFLLKFNVSGIGGSEVNNVKLRLYNNNPSDRGGSFRFVDDNSWNESTVVWNSAPESDSDIYALLGPVSSGIWYEVDLTNLITDDGVYSLNVSSISSNGADYNSKEAVSNGPQLVVTLGDTTTTPTPVSTPTLPPTPTPVSTPTSTPLPTPTVVPGDITFLPTNEDFANPERGFMKQSSIWPDEVFDPYKIRAKEPSDSLVWVYFRLDNYRDGLIDPTGLSRIRTTFETAREKGLKLVIRFIYNWGPGWTADPDLATPDVPLDLALQHIDQIKPILIDNVDVIAAMQAGFVGHWGEWHSSKYLYSSESRIAILDALLSALPEERMLQLRYPRYKEIFYQGPLTESDAFTGTDASRIGHHNDCFLSDDTDGGTYRSRSVQPPQQESLYCEGQDEVQCWKEFIAQESLYTPVGGESCSPNPPRSECSTAKAELDMLGWSFINNGFHAEVLESWNTGGCMEEIRRRLGYRYVLDSLNVSFQVNPGGVLDLQLNLHNEGYATAYNERPLFLVVEEKTTGYIEVMPLTSQDDPRTTDPRLWHSGQTITIDEQVMLPADLPEGVYNLYLWLPDASQSLRDRPEFAIRLANQDVWQASSGYNLLFDNLIVGGGPVITPTPTQTPTPTSTPPPTGDADGDGDVDESDYAVWFEYLGQSTENGPTDGDFNSDGLVDGVDYVIWLNSYGM